MPSSALEQIVPVMHVVDRVGHHLSRPLRVLDCGTGNGRYGMLLRDALDTFHQPDTWRATIDGIEAFSAYITPAHRYVYSSIMEGDMIEILPPMADRSYDMALLLDVIEHVTKAEGTQVLRQLLRVAPVVVIATPQRFFAQPDVYGNEAERHRSVWSIADFRAIEPAITSLSTINQVIVVLGGPAQIHRHLKMWEWRRKVRSITPPSLGATAFDWRERRHGRRPVGQAPPPA